MKKFICVLMLVSLVLCSYAAAEVAIDENNFPDSNFRNCIRVFDTDGDGILSDEEIAAVTDIEAPGQQISDLTGVGYFTALTRLNVSDNLLTRLDVSQNTELFDLVCNENRLTELVIKDNEKLADLYCRGNQLTSIEANPKIGNIECGNNPLESLDLTAYHELWGLSCRNCGLTELDLSRNPKMWVLMLDDNQLSSLDLSRCRKLMRLDAMNNQLTEVILGSSYMKEIILTGNPLKELDISMCPLICEVVKTRKYTMDKNFGYGSGWFRMEDGALEENLFIDKSVKVITE